MERETARVLQELLQYLQAKRQQVRPSMFSSPFQTATSFERTR